MMVSPLVDVMNNMTANALQSTMTVNCPRSMVGRVIGKGGETIKALQQYTGAMIQIDQSQDPTRVTIAGDAHSLRVATSMVKDIVEGNFKGFAMLRQMTLNQQDKLLPGWDSGAKPQPVYIEGYGFVPPSQFMGLDDTNAALAQTLRDTAIAQQSLPLSATDAMGSMTQSMAASGQYGGSVPTTNGGNRSPAARRLFQGGAGMSSGAATAAASSSFPSGAYQSAPTSPQNGVPNGAPAGASAPFDPRSAPTSPHSAALDLASFSLSPHTAPMPAAFPHAAMDAMGAGGMPTAQQALQLMGRHDFLSASAGIAGLTPESAAALQALGAAAAASRLGLDSSVASHAAFSGAQHMDAGPRSASMGALGTRTAAGFLGTHKPDNFSLAEVLAKGSPASSFNSSTSLFSGGGAVPVLPDNWVQLTDPEGRHFFMNVASRASQWEFPSPAYRTCA